MRSIDKLCLSFIGFLTLLMAGAIAISQACAQNCFLQAKPGVENFSWQDQSVDWTERAFILTFEQPMNRESVEKNLVIDPPLPGKISWAGKRLAYTLDAPIRYGENYQLRLEQAQEEFRDGRKGNTIKPFIANFHSRDRAFAYIGIRGEERGRLILYNLTQQRSTTLTPGNLSVVDFQFYPDGDRVLFSAAEKEWGIQGREKLQLYTIKLSSENGKASSPKRILDNSAYQNEQFELSPDGETVVLQRINRDNPADSDLWVVKPGDQPKRLNVQGGEFSIAPDGQTLAVARGEGISLLPLDAEAELIDFLPKFGQLLNFSPDGTAAVMVDFNTDDPTLRFTRSLVYVNIQGIEKELLNIEGSINTCKFTPQGNHLYCLLTRLLNQENYQEQPYFAKIDLETAQVTPLAALPAFQDIQSSLAPDGLAILFDQVSVTDSPSIQDILTTRSGIPIIDGRLWLLLPPPPQAPTAQQPELKALPIIGFHPQWMP